MPGFYFPNDPSHKGPSNRQELLKKLIGKAKNGDWNALALAYLINELVPEDRTTKRVIQSSTQTASEEEN